MHFDEVFTLPPPIRAESDRIPLRLCSDSLAETLAKLNSAVRAESELSARTVLAVLALSDRTPLGLSQEILGLRQDSLRKHVSLLGKGKINTQGEIRTLDQRSVYSNYIIVNHYTIVPYITRLLRTLHTARLTDMMTRPIFPKQVTSLTLFPPLPPTTQRSTPPSTGFDNLKMPQTRSNTTPKQRRQGSPPRSAGTTTRSQRKRATSSADNEAVQRKKSKTNLRDDETTKGGKKEKKPAGRKAKTR